MEIWHWITFLTILVGYAIGLVGIYTAVQVKLKDLEVRMNNIKEIQENRYREFEDDLRNHAKQNNRDNDKLDKALEMINAKIDSMMTYLMERQSK